MRIAVVHSYYRSDQPSGENTVVNEQIETLRRAGHEVELFSVNSDAIDLGPTQALVLAYRVATHGGHDFAQAIRRFDPDVLHIHNLFPSIGYHWLTTVSKPVVVTLHNYRPICAQGSFIRNGRECLECLTGGSRSAAIHGCYRGSRVLSLPMAWRNRKGAAGDPLLARADAVLVLSELAREIYLAAGLPAGKVSVVPNGLAGTALASSVQRSGWMCVSRLTPEKGVLELVAEWPSGVRLDIIGAGPLEERLSRVIATRPGIRWLGRFDRDSAIRAMAGAEGLVIPSICVENLPTVMLEAMQQGTPVLARHGNAAARFLEADGGGSVYRGPEDLAALLGSCNWAVLGVEARQLYERHFTSDVWLKRIEAKYREVCGDS